MVQVTIREAVMEDVEALVPLLNQLGYSADPAGMRTRLEMILSEPERQGVLVAAHDNGVIGLIHLLRRPTLMADCCVEIVSLVVAESSRSLGVGGRMLDAAEAWARRQNINDLMLYTNQKRERAHRFYERNGFRRIKESIMFQKEIQR